MLVRFLGAAGEVTGSNYLLKAVSIILREINEK